MTQTQDIFGETWIITRRIDSLHGVDLLYGRQPDSESGSTWHLIVTEELEEFILKNLATFPQLDLPIGQIRKVRLRRMISSRRYRNLADWEENRDPNEKVFWVDPEHIHLPEVRDIHDIPYLPSELRWPCRKRG